MAIYNFHPSAEYRIGLTGIARNTAYIVGDKRKPTTGKFWLICTTAGTSHATTEPTWNTTYNATTTDGTAVFTTKGTGDDHAPVSADRCWNVRDTFTAGNPNAIAAGDSLEFDVSGSYMLNAGMTSHVNGTASGRVFHYPINSTTGAFDPSAEIVFDGSGFTGAGYNTGQYHFWYRPAWINCSADGLLLGGTSEGCLYLDPRCESNGSNGISAGTGLGLCLIYGGRFLNNSATGVHSLNTALSGDTLVLYRTYANGNAGTDYTLSNGTIAIECIGRYAGGAKTGARQIFSSPFAAIACTAAQDAACNDAYANVGFNGSVVSVFMDCIAQGIKNSGTGAGTGVLGGTAFRNIYYDCEATTGSLTKAFDASDDTTNPTFTSATDFTPTVSLDGKASLGNIADEANWIGPGAVPYTTAAASGGVSPVYTELA